MLILLLAAALRWINVLRFPLFYDEAIHIRFAHQFTEGRPFAYLSESKWLFTAVMGLFNPAGPEGVWLGRTLAGMCGVFTTAACIALGRQLGGDRAGLVSGLIYAVLPMAVFHERQALTEPLMASFTTLAVIGGIRLVRAIDRRTMAWSALLLGLAVAGAFLTKLLAVTYLAIPLWAAVVMGHWQTRRRLIATLAWSIGATVLAGVVIAFTYYVASQTGTATSSQFQLSIYNTVLGTPQDTDIANRLRSDLTVVKQMAVHYIGWVGLALAALTLGEAIVNRTVRRAVLYLVLPTFGFAALPLLIDRTTGGDILPPRYFLSNSTLLIVLSTLGLVALLGRISSRRALLRSAVGVTLILGVVMPALAFDAALIRDPLSAPLIDIDRVTQYGLYFDGEAAVTGSALNAERRPEHRLRVIGYGLEVPLLAAYLGPRGADVLPRSAITTNMLAAWIAQGDPVFVVAGRDIAAERIDRSLPDEIHAEPAGTFRLLSGTAEVWRITGAKGSLAQATAEQSVPQPYQIDADLDALAGSMQSNQPPALIIAYPPAYADALHERGVAAEPLMIDTWPLDLQTAQRVIPFSADHDAVRLDVIRADEARSDPQQAIPRSVSAYLLGEEWFGLLHRQMYLTGPAAPEISEINTVWEDAIRLVGAAVLDREVQPGQPARILLRWQTSVPVRDSYSIFVHLIDEADRLRAQHDGIPGGGLLPMTSWEPDESVDDRFALALPADLPPGTYHLRVGIYHPMNGLRLRVTEGNADAPDFAWIGEITVK